jgi:hypothetical protein
MFESLHGRPLTFTHELLGIVRDFAKGDPTATTEIHGDPYCTQCDVDVEVTIRRSDALSDPANHKPECPWRRAVELMRELDL